MKSLELLLLIVVRFKYVCDTGRSDAFDRAFHYVCIQAQISSGSAWHGTDNVYYDCWPGDGSPLTRDGAIPCPGVLHWQTSSVR